jgi:hypothetical protein
VLVVVVAARLQEIKASMVERLSTIKDLLSSSLETDRSGVSDPKAVIMTQSSIRENIRQLTEEWREMDNVYRVEAKKKRSKFSKEELANQQHIVVQMNDEINKIKELQRAGYVKMNADDSGGGGGGGGNRSVVAMDQSSLFTTNLGDTSTALGTGGVEMTAQQSAQVQAIHERDQDFDVAIQEIGRGILDLQDIAVAQNEEVKRQNLMLDSLSNKIDNVHEHVTNVNSKMKTTLDTVSRSSDKFCVDIICIVLAIGFMAVIYSIYKETN